MTLFSNFCTSNCHTRGQFMMLYHLCGDTRLNACKFLVALGVPQLVEGHIKHLQWITENFPHLLKRFFLYVGLLFSSGEVCVCVWQSQDNEKCRRTKDKDKKCYQRWWSSAKTYQYWCGWSIIENQTKCPLWSVFPYISLNWLTQHFPVWIYDTCVNQNSK